MEKKGFTNKAAVQIRVKKLIFLYIKTITNA